MPGRRFTDEQEEVIAQEYLSGISERKLAVKYDCSRLAIRGALRRQGTEQRTPDERNRLYSLDNTVFDSIDNEHAAYWLGFLYADGNTNKRSLSVVLKGSDSNHLRKLASFLNCEHPVREYTEGKYSKTSLFVTDEHMVDKLKSFGITPRRPTPMLAINNVTENLYHHFIRGLWDSDGCAPKNPNDGIGFMGGKVLMRWVQVTIAANCNELELTRKLSKHTISDVYYLKYSGRRVGLAAFNYMFHDATIWLDRKRKVIENWPLPQKRFKDSKGRYI